MDQGAVLHSRFNRVTAIIVWVAAAVVLGAVIVSGDAEFVWLYPAVALAALLAWAALWVPGVSVDDRGVRVRNVTHTVVVPWEALIHVDTKHALTLHTPNGRVSVWSAPAPGFLASVAARRSDTNRERRSTEGELRPGDLAGTDSGDAALVVREAWQRRRAEGRIDSGVADSVHLIREWHVAVIVPAIVLLATVITLLAVTG